MSKGKLTRVFVIGGEVGESDEIDSQFHHIAKLLGEELGKRRNIQIVACSAHQSSADAGVIEGFANTAANLSGKVVIHHPLDNRSGLGAGDSITEQWGNLVEKTGLIDPQFRPNSNARVLGESSFSNAFLLCQIRALREDTDVVVALGGKRNASAALLMSIARDTYPIVPFSFMGGAAEQEYVR